MGGRVPPRPTYNLSTVYMRWLSFTTLLSSPPNESFFKQKDFDFQAFFFSKILFARLFVGMSEHRIFISRLETDSIFFFFVWL